MRNSKAHLRSPVIKPSSKPAVLALLKEKDRTAQEIAMIVDRHHDTIAALLRSLHGRAYIKDWTRDNGSYAAVWAYGDLPHKPRPVAETKKKRPPEKAEGVIDRIRLSSNYVTGERIWGI